MLIPARRGRLWAKLPSMAPRANLVMEDKWIAKFGRGELKPVGADERGLSKASATSGIGPRALRWMEGRTAAR